MLPTRYDTTCPFMTSTFELLICVRRERVLAVGKTYHGYRLRLQCHCHWLTLCSMGIAVDHGGVGR